MRPDFPRFAEKSKPPTLASIPRNGEPSNIQTVTMPLMDYKKEIGRRIKDARVAKSWRLEDLSMRTGDAISLRRISAYETGSRMPGPQEAVILAKALGIRPAYLMVLDDTQTPITHQEEALIRNWRTLPERERMEVFRKLSAMAMQYRDPVQDQVVEKHIPPVDNRPRRVRPNGNGTEK